MVNDGLLSVIYRPEEQRKTLAGGPGQTEMLVSLRKLNKARKIALDFPTKVCSYGYTNEENAVSAEVVILRGNTVIIVPTVSFGKLLQSYRKYGWPGLKIKSNDYTGLVGVARELGNLPVPREDCKYLREH